MPTVQVAIPVTEGFFYATTLLPEGVAGNFRVGSGKVLGTANGNGSYLEHRDPGQLDPAYQAPPRGIFMGVDVQWTVPFGYTLHAIRLELQVWFDSSGPTWESTSPYGMDVFAVNPEGYLATWWGTQFVAVGGWRSLTLRMVPDIFSEHWIAMVAALAAGNVRFLITPPGFGYSVFDHAEGASAPATRLSQMNLVAEMSFLYPPDLTGELIGQQVTFDGSG